MVLNAVERVTPYLIGVRSANTSSPQLITSAPQLAHNAVVKYLSRLLLWSKTVPPCGWLRHYSPCRASRHARPNVASAAPTIRPPCRHSQLDDPNQDRKPPLERRSGAIRHQRQTKEFASARPRVARRQQPRAVAAVQAPRAPATVDGDLAEYKPHLSNSVPSPGSDSRNSKLLHIGGGTHRDRWVPRIIDVGDLSESTGRAEHI